MNARAYTKKIRTRFQRDVIPALRRLPWYVNRMVFRTRTIHTQQGIFEIPLTAPDPISLQLYTKGQFEKDLADEVLPIVRRLSGLSKGQGILLDIGANNGVISIGMLTNGEMESAIAIEPEPGNFQRLTKNIAHNHLENRITSLNRALSDRKGSLTFELSKTNFGDHRVRNGEAHSASGDRYGEAGRTVISVDAERLDDVISRLPAETQSKIALIWMDVQGYEGYVLSGGPNFLSTGIPVCSEVWPYGIKRSGMSEETFCNLIQQHWTHYWLRRKNGFVRYPISIFPTLFQELGYDGASENVLLTKERS